MNFTAAMNGATCTSSCNVRSQDGGQTVHMYVASDGGRLEVHTYSNSTSTLS